MERPKARLKIPPNGSKSAIFAPAARQSLGPRPGRIDPGQTPYPGAGIFGTAQMRVGQNRRQQGGLARRQAGGGAAEGVTRPCLGAELAGRSPFGNVEVN